MLLINYISPIINTFFCFVRYIIYSGLVCVLDFPIPISIYLANGFDKLYVAANFPLRIIKKILIKKKVEKELKKVKLSE